MRNSNPENFVMDINQKTPLVLPPHSTTEISVYFHPSGLGRDGHETCINFYCTQFKEWKFHLFGVGLFPSPIDAQRITTILGLQASVMIHFKNPTREAVSIDLILTNKEEPKNLEIDHCWNSFLHENSAFRFSSLRRSHDRGEIQAIHWMYPIIGLPQAPPPKSSAVVIKCQANKRIEEKVEVTMIGNFFGHRPSHDKIDFVVFPKRNSIDSIYEEVDVIPKRREFEYEIEFESEEMKSNLDSSVSLYLFRKHFNTKQQLISLIFNVIFTPKKPFRTHIILKVECITDGIWRFPITLIATEPEVEDVINIQGIGLFKTAITEFRLTSQTRYY
ncbi:hypothetical protein U0070_003126, partial [Myodes glareolus]